MEPDEAERLCEALADLASHGPARDPQSLARAGEILRKIAQSATATGHVRERCSEVDRALRGWLDSDARFERLLKNYRGEIYALIDRLHGALRETAHRGPRRS